MNLSYSNDLWSGQDTIQLHFSMERERIRNLLFVLQERKNLEKEYAENLKLLSNYYNTLKPSSSKNSSCFNTFNKAIEMFFEQIKMESEIHMKNVSSIENDIIYNLSEMLSKQFTKSKELDNEFKCGTISKFRDVIKGFESKQQEYYSSVKLAENKILSNQKLIDDNVQKGKTNFKLPSKDDDKQKATIKFAKTKEKEYQAIVKDTNESRTNYINKIQNIMTGYQTLDDEFIQCIKVTFNEYSNLTVQLYNQLKDVYDKGISVYNDISSSKDINNFIEKNKTMIRPPDEFKFIPYSSELVSQRIGGKKVLRDNVYNKVVKILDDTFVTTTSEYEEFKSDYEFINKEAISIFDDSNNKDENISNSKILNLLKQKDNYRIYFLNTINQYRIKGLFQITKKTYNILVYIMNVILETSFTEEDFKTIKLCMILSETFYTGEDKKRIDQGLYNYDVFMNEKTWRSLITYSIDEKLNYVNSYENYFGENASEREKRIVNAVRENLLTYRYNMQNFKFPLEKAKPLIDEFAKKYDINVDEIYGVDIGDNEFAENVNKVSHEEIIG